MDQTPVPFRQVVLKVHSRCDLACDHCYMYEHADQSWRGRPKVMTDKTAALVGTRIAEHAREHRLPSVKVVLHGGEPLLAGPRQLRDILEALLAEVGDATRLDLRIHTNGVLLSEAFCDLFTEFGVLVGVSLDGDRAANDRHRNYADGRTSHPQVLAALALLRRPEYRHLYRGLLCTIDIANDPIEVYEALLAEEPPRVDLLLPHATWDTPPPKPQSARAATEEEKQAPYAQWLNTIHDRWTADGRPMSIRMFDSVHSTLRGGPSLTESLGLAPSDVVVIETDGEIEQLDSLKAAFDGAPTTGYHVADHSLDLAAAHPGIAARQGGLASLCATCQACPVVSSCGGGLYPHRFRSDAGSEDRGGFDNPSVYCADLLSMITHIDAADRRDPPPATRSHTLSPEDLAGLAAGFGDATAVDHLAQAQRSIRRALLGGLAEAVPTTDRLFHAAWQELARIDRQDPDAVDSVLAHPYVRAWAVRTLQDPATAPTGHLAAIAVTAAVRAKSPARIEAPIRGSEISLPTLGRLLFGAEDGPRALITVAFPLLHVTTARGTRSVIIDPVAARDENWQPARTLTAIGAHLLLEDGDPERDCHQWPAHPPLTVDEHAEWQHRFSAAWQLIRRDYPRYASGLGAGLNTVMPLAPHPDGDEISATARQAFGVVAAALPDTPEALALLLIHEFQHVKLGAILDLYDLYDEADTRLYYAPWRRDPRPLEGLLQGTYAHIAVTDFWRVRCRTAPGQPARQAAAVHFARWRTLTAEAIEVLAESGALTPLGRYFIQRMRATVAPWLRAPLPQDIVVAAQRSSAEHRAAWEELQAAHAQTAG
jgi:uncharacterized protein